jgi:hypothetical protein
MDARMQAVVDCGFHGRCVKREYTARSLLRWRVYRGSAKHLVPKAIAKLRSAEQHRQCTQQVVSVHEERHALIADAPVKLQVVSLCAEQLMT